MEQALSKMLLLLIVALAVDSAAAQTKKMCITIDDLPAVAYGKNDADHRWHITHSIVNTLEQFDARAIGYVNESKLYNGGRFDSVAYQMLEYWLSHGQDLGNHTYAHPNYHKVGLEAFSADILKGEQHTKALCARYGKELKYFRHPYLRSGANRETSDALLVFLAEHGYEEAPVTIDNDDYLFAVAYHRAFVRGDEKLMDSIGTSFIDYMEAKLIHFEKLSSALFDREIDQTLLLHANLLNAHWLDELLTRYASHGYTFVSQEEILRDPAYQTQVTKFGDWGISWLDRWALSRNQGKELFSSDPRVPAFIGTIK
ncbi:MAG: polysaccharide deacetylase family protein [Bacteroidota bacterium]